MKSTLILLFFFLLVSSAGIAQITITGRVVDTDNQSLPGVSIVVKGTQLGSISDIKGDYTIVASKEDILVFSFMGMLTEEILVGDQSKIDVTLIPDIKNLDEVVVVGYGDVKRVNLLGSVADMKTDEIVEYPSTNLSTLLEGRLAGVRVGQASGKPGAGTSMQIRTSSSWNGETPIFVIDGVIYEDQSRLDILDPNDVESISVLKDASAAVYGVRAAGGVVIVKTKRGEVGKPKISYSGTFGVTDAVEFPKMLSAYDQAVLINDALRIGYPANYSTRSDYYTEDELEYFKTVNYDWLDEAWKKANLNRHTINISGGTEKFKYYGGGSYYYETGNFDNLYSKKYTLRLGIEALVTKDLTVNASLSIDNKEDQRPYNDYDDESDPLRGTFKSLLQTPRWIPPYLNGLPVGQQGLVTSHPLEIENIDSYANSKGSNYNLNTSLEYQVPFINGLKLRFSYSFDYGNSYGKQYRVPYYLYTFATTGGHRHILTDQVTGEPQLIDNGDQLQESIDLSNSYQINQSISYDKKIGKHDINALLVFEQAENKGNGFKSFREDQIVPTYDRLEGFSESKDGTSSTRSNGARSAYIGRVNYRFADKYLLEAAFRYEGSVKFPPESRWGLFPSVALGWIISDESFFKDNIDFVDYLKLRVSGGIVGNDKSNLRQWEQSYAITGGAYLGGSSVTNAVEPRNNSIVLRGVTWEKSQSYNYGLDMKFSNRITLSLDGFYRYTYDILSERKSILPTTTGIDRMPKENYGKMDGWGWEADAGYDLKLFSNLELHFGGNLSFARSKVLEKYQNPAAIGTWKDEIGKMPNGEVGYYCTGIIRTQEEANELRARGWTIFGKDPEPGMLNYKDMGSANYSDSLDGKIDESDQRILEEFASAPYTYGFNLGIKWKEIKISANFSGSFGHKVFMEKEVFKLPDELSNIYKLKENLPYFWKDHWTPENTDAKYPRVFNNGGEERSTFWARDGHTLRLSSISVSYSIPKRISEKIHIPSLSIVFSARNLWTIINPYDYKDPSVSKFNGYPILRSINLGINMTI